MATTIDYFLFAGVCAVTTLFRGASFRGRDLVVVTVAIYVAIAVMQALWGKTPGKYLCGLSVVSRTGGRPSLWASFTRNAWMLCGVVPVIGGVLELLVVSFLLVTVHRDSLSRGVHDVFTETATVKGVGNG
ncbi:RDD family protein [Corynebacterium hindlerae]|uniref:RDD family protein n=2 Tax=Corynebacterium hindlerae TaxID=699041 RepID=A0A7G5FHU8_9CORY|nr:RDD family protein [Corynebacterium hindlerae]QMV86189.1 RDD family protein [Corynebacterium hindlerae]